MNGCVIPHTPIVVDYWKIRECPQAKIFFLTHLHGDHITGLTSSWRFPIYCSEITKQLLVHKLGIDENLINVLEIGCTKIIYLDNDNKEQMSVTAIDAQHCPGAIMILMEGYFGTILHSGDFRYHSNMIKDSILSQYSGKIDTLYLDNTYCTPSCEFPLREDAVRQVIDIIEKHPSHDILIAMRNLGKETLLCKIAQHFHEWISVSGRFYEALQLIGAPDVFDCSSTEHRIRVVQFHKVSNRFVAKMNEVTPTIVIIPTALFVGVDATPYANNDKVFVVPYSDHSSYSELAEFVSFFKPGKIIPIVGAKSRGPFGCSVANRADMSQFAKWTKGVKTQNVVVPQSVQTFMNSVQSISIKGNNVLKRKKKTQPKANVKKMRKGVVYDEADSPDLENTNADCDKQNGPVPACEDDKENSGDISLRIDSFDAQLKSMNRLVNVKNATTFGKTHGIKTYAKVFKKTKSDANNEEMDELRTQKVERCKAYVDSIDTDDFDIIEEVNIDWSSKSSGSKSRRRAKRFIMPETDDDDDIISHSDIENDISFVKGNSSTKRKNLKQKSISDFIPNWATYETKTNDSLSCDKEAVKEDKQETILIDSSDSETSKNYIDTKLNKPTTNCSEEVNLAGCNISDTDSEIDRDRLVIDTDSEHMSDNLISTNEKSRWKTRRKISNITYVVSDKPEVSVINETLEEREGSVLMEDANTGNEDAKCSLIPQIGTKYPKDVEFSQIDIDRTTRDSVIDDRNNDATNVDDANDDDDGDKDDCDCSLTAQIGTQYPKNVELSQLEIDRTSGGKHDDLVIDDRSDGEDENCSLTAQIGTQFPKDEDCIEIESEKDTDIDISHSNKDNTINDHMHSSMSAEIGTQNPRDIAVSDVSDDLAVYETSNDYMIVDVRTQRDDKSTKGELDQKGDNSLKASAVIQQVNKAAESEFVDESCKENEEVDNLTKGHSICMINDSTEAIAGTQTFIQQTFDGEENTAEKDDNLDCNQTFEFHEETNMADHTENEHVKSLDVEEISEVFLNKTEAECETTQKLRTNSNTYPKSSTPNSKHQPCTSKYFMKLKTFDEEDSGFDVSSLKFKPLKDKRKSNGMKVSVSSVCENDCHISVRPSYGADSLTDDFRPHENVMISKNSELNAFIKAFKYFDDIRAEKERNGTLAIEEMLRKKAYNRYLDGVASGEYKEHTKCSYRITPI